MEGEEVRLSEPHPKLYDYYKKYIFINTYPKGYKVKYSYIVILRLHLFESFIQYYTYMYKMITPILFLNRIKFFTFYNNKHALMIKKL